MTVPATVDYNTGTNLPMTPTDTGLHLAGDLTWDQWVQLGRPLLRGAASSMWWVGDWLLYAEHRWATDDQGDEVSVQRARIRSTVSEMTSMDLQTLKNARSVAKRIPPGRRRAGVSWSHHQDVAPLDPELADRLLAQAEAEGWSRNDLRAAVKAASATDVEEVPEEEKPLRMAIRLIGAPSDEAVLEELVRAQAEQLEVELGVRGVRATVEVA